MECNDPEQVQFIGRLEIFLLCQYKYFFFVHLLCSSAFISFSLCGQYRQ